MKRQWWVLPALFLASFLLRASALFRSVVDWDESLYLLIAREMLAGNAPYTTIWNNLPSGIYGLFAAVLLLFPDSILAVRLFTCAAATLTAFAVYRLGVKLGNRRVGLVAGALYVLYSSSPVAGGLASNTELFYTVFTTWAFVVLLSNQDSPRPLMVGLLFGVGFQIKYHVAFDLLAALMIVGIEAFKLSEPRAALRQWGLMLAGFLMPLAAVAAGFLLTGHLRAYVDSAILANLIYTAGGRTSLKQAFWVLKDQLLYHPLIWLGSALVGLELIQKRTDLTQARDRLSIFIWFVMSLLGVLATRRFWDHYFLQMLPSMCLLTAFVVDDILGLKMPRLQRITILVLILLATPLPSPLRENLDATAIAVRQWYIEGTEEWKDTPRRVAEYLNKYSKPGEFIYVADYQPVIYFLAHAQCPTRYPFPPHLTDPALNAMTGIDPVSELHAIMSKAPTYVVRRRDPEHAPSPFYAALEEHLAKAYTAETWFDDGDGVTVDLYRRIETAR